MVYYILVMYEWLKKNILNFSEGSKLKFDFVSEMS